MELGWIDFTSDDGEIIKNVINSLEDGDIDLRDALGVGVIRDRFANYFFPGTTTLQSSAKYFFLVPYVFQKLEKKKFKHIREYKNELKTLEKEQCNKLLENREINKNGNYNRTIIGSRAIKNKNNERWINNTPSNIYWGGLKAFGILKKDDLSINEYLTLIMKKWNDEETIKNVINKKEEGICDDDNADLIDKTSLWDMLPESINDSIDGREDMEVNNKLSLDLTYEEAYFLKNKIIESKPDSLLAWMLLNKENVEILNSTEGIKTLSFDDLINENIYIFLPERLKELCLLAKKFSDFFYIIEIRYNMIYSEFENNETVQKWNSVKKDAKKYALTVDIDKIFKALELENTRLKDFLNKCKKIIENMNEEELDNQNELKDLDACIINREKDNKTISHAKLSKTVKGAKWIGLDKLTYRINPGKNIVHDILKGLENSNE